MCMLSKCGIISVATKTKSRICVLGAGSQMADLRWPDGRADHQRGSSDAPRRRVCVWTGSWGVERDFSVRKCLCPPRDTLRSTERQAGELVLLLYVWTLIIIQTHNLSAGFQIEKNELRGIPLTFTWDGEGGNKASHQFTQILRNSHLHKFHPGVIDQLRHVWCWSLFFSFLLEIWV